MGSPALTNPSTSKFSKSRREESQVGGSLRLASFSQENRWSGMTKGNWVFPVLRDKKMINTTSESPERPQFVFSALPLQTAVWYLIVLRGHFIIELAHGICALFRKHELQNNSEPYSFTTPSPERQTGTGNDVMYSTESLEGIKVLRRLLTSLTLFDWTGKQTWMYCLTPPAPQWTGI